MIGSKNPHATFLSNQSEVNWDLLSFVFPVFCVGNKVHVITSRSDWFIWISRRLHVRVVIWFWFHSTFKLTEVAYQVNVWLRIEVLRSWHYLNYQSVYFGDRHQGLHRLNEKNKCDFKLQWFHRCRYSKEKSPWNTQQTGRTYSKVCVTLLT